MVVITVLNSNMSTMAAVTNAENSNMNQMDNVSLALLINTSILRDALQPLKTLLRMYRLQKFSLNNLKEVHLSLSSIKMQTLIEPKNV